MQRGIIQRLKSRKLWMSIASFVSMLMIYLGDTESEAAQVAALIMASASIIGYVIGEGLADSSDNTSVISDYVAPVDSGADIDDEQEEVNG